jgi:hypothetical protein
MEVTGRKQVGQRKSMTKHKESCLEIGCRVMGVSEKEHEQFLESCLETDWSDRGIAEKKCVKE